MPKSSAGRSPYPGTDDGVRSRLGSLLAALQLVAAAGFVVFVALHRDPVPEESLAALAARWADVAQSSR